MQRRNQWGSLPMHKIGKFQILLALQVIFIKLIPFEERYPTVHLIIAEKPYNKLGTDADANSAFKALRFVWGSPQDIAKF